VVPYPVIVGSYGYGYGPGYDGPPAGPGPGPGGEAPPILNTNAAPSVVINQTFIPDRAQPIVRDYSEGPPDQQQSGMHIYEGLRTQPQPDPRALQAGPNPASDLPTLYLIGFKNGNIVQALGYWVEGNTLNYVSAEHTVNQASLDLIDRQLSQRLNDERSVEFRLPPAK
jgi:hypothetical protein